MPIWAKLVDRWRGGADRCEPLHLSLDEHIYKLAAITRNKERVISHFKDIVNQIRGQPVLRCVICESRTIINTQSAVRQKVHSPFAILVSFSHTAVDQAVPGRIMYKRVLLSD